MAACNLCGEGPITWARTEGGKGMPVWSRPDPRGTAWWVDTPDGRRLRVASAAHPKPAGERMFRPHFLDCEVHAAKKRLEQAIKRAAKAKADKATEEE